MRLRFAPSPTGFLHVGGARTAIFNLLHARRHGGRFILRIEDTDVERSEARHADQILRSMEWLGVEWDEGPYFQSQRLPLYREKVEQLLAAGHAYRCFCTVEELAEERKKTEASGLPYRYSGKCREIPGLDPDVRHVIRFRIPEGDAILIRDRIRGDVRVDRSVLDDFILVRTDGNPTYHLSVVVDDVDMGITLVARGEDHLSNTPKHVLLFDALGSRVPEFAHVPLILGSDKKRLSKRTGATSVEEYRDLGVLPQALFNFLTLLGWSPGNDREIITREEAERVFDLGNVNRSAAVFDTDKLMWMNGQYLGSAPLSDVITGVRAFIRFEVDDADRLESVVELNRTRARSLADLAESIRPYFASDDEIEYDEQAVKKHLRGEKLGERIERLRDRYQGLEPWTVESTEQALREVAESMELGGGKLIHPLRLAVTGRGVSPPVFDVLALVGREATVARLDRLLEFLKSEE